MNYYKRHIGDYAKKAGRLTMLQHGAFTLLTDTCYDRECFPTKEQAIDWTWASSAAEIEAVEFVLRKFFTLEGDVYVQQDIQRDLAEYHQKAETNKRIANERESKRKTGGTSRSRVVDDASPNHKPLTNNHKPKEQGASVAGEEGGPAGPAHAGVESEGQDAGSGSVAQQVADAMRAVGLDDVSATHPMLVELLAAGMTADELVDAARYAVKNGRGFVYAMHRAKGQREDAVKAVAMLPDAPRVAAVDPDSKAGIEASAKALGLPEWDQTREQYRQWADRVRKARGDAPAAAAPTMASLADLAARAGVAA